MTRDEHSRRRADAAAAAPDPRAFPASTAAQQRLHDLVPGGAHTYARGEDQYPDGMAPILVRGKGSHVWDVDGHEFVEYGAGLRSVTLGHAFAPVTDAVAAVLGTGNNFSRPTSLELAAAEDFLRCVPTAEMVKFAKNGSDATTAAVRLARSVTGRTTIAVCDQPFFSVDDWFIGTTAMNGGTRAVDTVGFRYNDINSLRAVLADRSVAAVFLEAATAMAEPEPGFLQAVRDLCTATGTVLVFDEMITGFRWAAGGAQSVYGITPDLSCWGKALGNGFPISALAGRRDLMEAGGLRAGGDRVFLLSTTHGPESTSLAAMRAVIDHYGLADPVGRMESHGQALADGINAAAAEHGVVDHFYAAGRPSCLVFVTKDADGRPSQSYRTLAMQELIARGVLGQSLVNSAAHDSRDVTRTIEAFADLMPIYRRAIEDGSTNGLLRGRPVAPALRATAAPRPALTLNTDRDLRFRAAPDTDHPEGRAS
ncbi:glutamate-1-semialdehyde 2,1-aminomutase [Gordonia soli]|uniref:glutamate-1-semialdehyde 2,1-aminomutase n=1 Tax=Gordonia soli TaxID=320799 RepID=UPI00248156E3|nr:glutamate-1-semialdehyde 2,1-aminomutase [Gordonia soli]